jgi:two-component system CheB/CheR fusion protein
MSESDSGAPEPSREPPAAPRPTIVGIGASAGGLEALKRFFSAVPAESGLSYVVVVHLPAEGESHLPDLLQPHAPIPVLQVTELTALERDRA